MAVKNQDKYHRRVADTLTYSRMRVFTLIVAVIYWALAFVQLIVNPGAKGQLIFWNNLSTGFLIFFIYLAIKFEFIRRRHCQMACALVGLACLPNLVYHASLVGEPYILVNYYFILLTAAGVLMSWLWYGVIAVAVFIAYALSVVLMKSDMAVLSQHFMFIGCSYLLGTFFMISRRATFRALILAKAKDRFLYRELYRTRLRDKVGLNARSELLRDLSHNIRTPLSVMVNTVELMEMSPLSEEQRNYLGRIKSSGFYLSELAQKATELSRIHGQDISASARPFSIGVMIKSIESIIQPLTTSCGLVFGVKNALHHDSYLGDELLLKQVLFNLLENAIKYTDSGRVDLVIEELDSQEQTARLRFVVTDTGSGIESKDCSRIFSPFERAESTRSIPGTGLGLTICQNYVRAMGGLIEVSSVPGKGSCFHFSLALQKTFFSIYNEAAPRESHIKTALV